MEIPSLRSLLLPHTQHRDLCLHKFTRLHEFSFTLWPTCFRLRRMQSNLAKLTSFSSETDWSDVYQRPIDVHKKLKARSSDCVSFFSLSTSPTFLNSFIMSFMSVRFLRTSSFHCIIEQKKRSLRDSRRWFFVTLMGFKRCFFFGILHNSLKLAQKWKKAIRSKASIRVLSISSPMHSWRFSGDDQTFHTFFMQIQVQLYWDGRHEITSSLILSFKTFNLLISLKIRFLK